MDGIPKAEQIARQILNLSRNLLVVNFRYLDRSVARLPFSAAGDLSLATDGETIYFGSWFVLRRYRQEQTGITRDLMHMILHCVFRHSFVGTGIDRERWDLACDIAVEHMITQMQSPLLHSERESRQKSMISLLTEELPHLTAERIYGWLGEKDFGSEELISARESFLADGHGLWYGTADKNAKQNKNIDLKKIWEEISRRMQTELETMQHDSGSALVQNLRQLNKAKYSYGEFLRRFAVHGELMKLSNEEFDQNFYTYGLDLYGNVPLIEPLEYSEQKRIRDFVIAIDTSGSVRGEVVQAFIQHTHDILHEQDTFFSQVNLRIIQCDCCIREDAVIHTREEFETYIRSLEIKGLGRTDFRPVFAHVDELIRSGELRQLQGLIYFTDGDGIYPEAPPNYETAFILSTQDADETLVPGWAIRMTLSQEDSIWQTIR